MKRHSLPAAAAQHARALRLNVIDGHAVAADDDRQIDAFTGEYVQLLEIGTRERDDVELACFRYREGEPSIAELVELAGRIAREQVLAHERREGAMHHVLVEPELAREIGDAARTIVAEKRAENSQHAAR